MSKDALLAGIHSSLMFMNEAELEAVANFIGSTMRAAPAYGGLPPHFQVEEQTFKVTLIQCPSGSAKVDLIRLVRDVTGFGLIEAKRFVEMTPSVVRDGMMKADAEELKRRFEAYGGVVKVS